MTTRNDQTLAEAVDDLKRALADTAAWRMLVRFVERHPRVSLLAFPVTLTGLAAYYAVTGHHLEAAFMGGVMIAYPWMMKR
ncbi:hypothetical protein [Phenylobacterium sp.]|uniref:hypothetical protein n=1 Tax=Phenylobacterium sp. TaxID=1871053 RepID=UPI0030017CD9